jgi:lysophospholipase L1-like esterase
MSTTDELLEEMLEDAEEYATPVTDDDLQFWIDEHLRVISIPKNGVVAGVEGDKNVNKIKFGMNRYYHGFDMSTFSGRILYSNAKGNKNYYNITDMQASGSTITFSWLVDADAVQYMGKTAFVVYLFKIQGSELRQKFYSTLATLKVLEGLEGDSAVPVEKQTDIIERMKEEISAYAEEVKKSLPADYTAMTEQVSSLKEDLGDTSNELYKKEEREIAVDSSDYNLLENKVAYIDTNNEVMTYENANAYVMHKNVISGEKYRILSQTHGSVNTLLYAICDSNGKVINSAKMGVPINTYITTEITIPSNGVELYLNEFPTQTYPLVVNKIETINISKINGKETVNCWGDSLTRGVGVGDSYSKTFPYVLHGLLDGRKVINCGVGGENTINIASRQGGLPNIVKPFTIPANASKVEIELTNIYGDSTGILLQGGSALDPTTGQYVMTAQINPCSINGVEGTLTHENGKYYFSRSENGESVIVSRPTPLITHAMKSLRDNINIIWLGTNGGFTTSAELIENIEAMIDYMTPINKKYIVFGIHHLVSTVTETFETIEKNMAMHFGRHYINQRKYMIEYGLSDAGITPTVEDTTAISQGKIPPSLLYDDVHYNDKGYNIIATLASERGKELGYW